MRQSGSVADLVQLEHRIAIIADAWDADRSDDDEPHRRFVEALRRHRDLLQPSLLELADDEWVF